MIEKLKLVLTTNEGVVYSADDFLKTRDRMIDVHDILSVATRCQRVAFKDIEQDSVMLEYLQTRVFLHNLNISKGPLQVPAQSNNGSASNSFNSLSALGSDHAEQEQAMKFSFGHSSFGSDQAEEERAMKFSFAKISNN